MSKYLWILGGTTLAVAAWLVMSQQLGQPATSEGLHEAAGKLGAWGAKQRVTGAGGQLFGKAEQGVGDVAGSEKLGNQGALDEAAGAVKNTVGKAATAVGGAIENLKS